MKKATEKKRGPGRPKKVQPQVVEAKPLVFYYHSPDKRYVVAAQTTLVPGKSKEPAQVGLDFGVSVTKREDAWSKADTYNPTTGRIKALGQAKSQFPSYHMPLNHTEDESTNFQIAKKAFNDHAAFVGAKVVAAIEQELQAQEAKYLQGKAIVELIQFYNEKTYGSKNPIFVTSPAGVVLG